MIHATVGLWVSGIGYIFISLNGYKEEHGVKRLKKRKFISGILVIALLGTLLMPPIQVKAATQNSLRNKLQENTSETIRKFLYQDMNGDGRKEAVAITSSRQGEFGYTDAKVWYITPTVCKKIVSCSGWDLYSESIKVYKLKKTRMLTFEAGAGGSGWLTYAYTFKENQAKEVKNIGSGITYLGKNQFEITDSQYDALVDGVGHTWNKYYSKWDGKKLVEYGGLKISQAQLKKAKNGARILAQIKKQGKIGNIYYRANGMIFINYTADGANFNVSLKLKNGALKYYYTDEAYGSTDREKATNEGIIHKSISKCVKYPKSFRVK